MSTSKTSEIPLSGRGKLRRLAGVGLAVPYRVAAENEAARLEAEEFRRDLAAIRTRSKSDWIRLAGALVTLVAVASILYGTFHRHADMARTDEVEDARCREAMTISPNGTARVERFCGGFRDR